MTVKRILPLLGLAVLLWGQLGRLVAQQESIFTQYMFNRLVINPAYAGTKDLASASVLYRQQWFGFRGGPSTFNVAAHGQVAKGKIGLGGFILNDQAGPTGRTAIAADVAYRVTTKIGVFSLGLQVAALNHRVNLNDVQTDLPDPSFQAGNRQSWRPDFGAGLFYNNGKLYAGFSVLHLVEFPIGLYGGDRTRLNRTYFFTAGYDIALGSKLTLTPSAFLRTTVKAPVSFDLNANLMYKQLVWGGILYRYQDAVALLVGVYPIPRLRIGLAYDIPISRIRPHASGSLEAFISIDFGKSRNTRLVTPRYFN